MIKARKGKLVILGLSDENMKRLASGDPILFNMKKDLNMEDIDVLIYNGRTEEEMYESMKDQITSTTQFIDRLHTKTFDA